MQARMPETAAAPTASSMRSLEGTMVRDSYLLKRLLGEGTFGGVFLSEQRFIGVPVREVAVKISTHTGLDQQTARDIFADAFILAQAMSEMDDARARGHLVHVYEAGIVPGDGRGYIVMEYIKGTTLREQFASFQRVPAPQLLKWARQICLALRGLHTLDTPVIHRDLKPENILLGVDLAVRVVDFGLAAKLLAHGYVPGVAGTVAYMAPETSQGWSVPASDVYSVGVILYEGLTGRLPYAHLVPPVDLPAALHTDWLYKHKKPLRVLPPSQQSNTSTPGLDAVVLRCLEFDPGDRYRHAGELLDTLDALDAPSKSSGDPVSTARQLRAEGDLASARKVLEAALAADPRSVDRRFALLRELGEVLVADGQAALGADRLKQAWELARETAVLRTRAARADLLEAVANAFRAAGQDWQAGRFGRLARDERGQ
jgi:eukaryotic-like serine/threonine-protein kinase